MGFIDFKRYTTVNRYITENYKNIAVIDYNAKTSIAIITCPECDATGEIDAGSSSSDGWHKKIEVCPTCNGNRVIKIKVPKK